MERRKRTSGIAVILLVALLCVGAVFIARAIVSRRATGVSGAVSTPIFADQTLAPLGNGIVYYDGTTLRAIDERARQLWTYAIGASAGFRVGSGGVAAWSGSTLTLLTADKGEMLYGGSLNTPILDACMGELYTAVQLGEEHNSEIRILDASGRQVDQIALPNVTVLDYGFFNKDALLWVMTLNTEGTVPACSVSTYQPGKMLRGTISDTQQVLYDALFQSNLIRLVGVNYVKDFDYTGKEITADRMLVYGWYLMAMDEEDTNPLMCFVPLNQIGAQNAITDLRLIRGSVDQSMHLPYAAISLVVRGDTAYAFTNQYVMVCKLGESSPRAYTLPLYVDAVLGVTKNSGAIVASGGMVYIIPLK